VVLNLLEQEEKPTASGDNESKWETIKKADKTITISPEWEMPINLDSPLNTIGWEDSVSIAPDGNTITFAYFRIDPIALYTDRVRVDGPFRPDWPKEEPWNSYGADIYIARKVNGVWNEPQNIEQPVNLFETADGDQWLSFDGNRIYFNSAETGRKKGIYFAERKNNNSPWQTPQYLNEHITSGYEDENPYLSADEKFLVNEIHF